MPQKLKSRAMEMIRRLSVERFFGIISFIRKPNTPPSANTPMLIRSGLMMSQTWNAPAPVLEDTATEIAML